MQITQTTVITRANTDISWPGINIETDPNNPFVTKTNFTENVTYSDTQLVKTVVRVWTDKALYASDTSYNNVAISTAWHNDLSTEGLTYNMNINTTA